jgi:hypothetical protein
MGPLLQQAKAAMKAEHDSHRTHVDSAPTVLATSQKSAVSPPLVHAAKSAKALKAPKVVASFALAVEFLTSLTRSTDSSPLML